MDQLAYLNSNPDFRTNFKPWTRRNFLYSKNMISKAKIGQNKKPQ